MAEQKYDNFVFYGSWRETLEGFADELGQEYAEKALWNLMTCATAGDVSTTSPIILGFINGCCLPNISAAKDRYAVAKENGKKDGRPKTIDDDKIIALKEAGMTNKEVAEAMGCSVSTVEKATRKNRKNLEKEKDIDIDIDIEKDIEKEKKTLPPIFDEI